MSLAQANRRLVGLGSGCSLSAGCYTDEAMDSRGADPVLLVSPRWQTRALLAAEVGERVARHVISAVTVNDALGMIKLGGIEPVVTVVDAQRQIGPEDVERLLDAKREVPLLLVIGRLRRDAFDRICERCSVCLVRPVSIGAVAEAVVRLVQGQGCSA